MCCGLPSAGVDAGHAVGDRPIDLVRIDERDPNRYAKLRRRETHDRRGVRPVGPQDAVRRSRSPRSRPCSPARRANCCSAASASSPEGTGSYRPSNGGHLTQHAVAAGCGQERRAGARGRAPPRRGHSGLRKTARAGCFERSGPVDAVAPWGPPLCLAVQFENYDDKVAKVSPRLYDDAGGLPAFLGMRALCTSGPESSTWRSTSVPTC